MAAADRMTTDLDIYRSAALLIDQHGEGVSLQPISYATTGSTPVPSTAGELWARIEATVVELLRENPGEGEAVH